jgi:hypothetical protein
MISRPELLPLSLTGDLRRGGWQLAGEVRGDTDAVSAGLNVLGKGRSLSDYIDLQARRWMNGHVLAQPDFSFDRYSSQANFTVATVDAHLAGLDLQDLSFATVASPSNPHEATSWTFASIITHILQHHTNAIYDPTGVDGAPDGIITTLDFNSTSTEFSTVGDHFIVGHSENLWTTLQNIGGGEEGGGEFYRIWCTRRNVIRYQPAPPFISPQPAAKGTLTKEHIRGQVQVRFNASQPGQRVGQVKIVAGINPATIFKAKYPASPGRGKIVRKDSGVWAEDQSRANLLAQRLYKWLTRSWTLTAEIDPGLVLFGDNGRGLELGDRLLLTFDGPAEDADTGAGVHLDLSAQSVFVYGVNVNFDPAGGAGQAFLTLEHDNSA